MEFPTLIHQTSELSLKCTESLFLLVTQLVARPILLLQDGMSHRLLQKFLAQMPLIKRTSRSLPVIQLDVKPILPLLDGMFQHSPLMFLALTKLTIRSLTFLKSNLCQLATPLDAKLLPNPQDGTYQLCPQRFTVTMASTPMPPTTTN